MCKSTAAGLPDTLGDRGDQREQTSRSSACRVPSSCRAAARVVTATQRSLGALDARSPCLISIVAPSLVHQKRSTLVKWLGCLEVEGFLRGTNPLGPLPLAHYMLCSFWIGLLVLFIGEPSIPFRAPAEGQMSIAASERGLLCSGNEGDAAHCNGVCLC